ncbi:MAG: UbiA family prenyltransferase [Acidobacteria bacterium]|nr:UbiA family prenyltransferase [Acidobacteriota bacterium]
MQTLRAILRLTRVDSSLLSFLAIFLPLSVRTKDVVLSLSTAIPLLFIGMCTFIANDLDDIEKDRVNHPERPLPAHHLTSTVAVILYFTFLAAALFSTRQYVAPDIAFLYYTLIALSISYGYIVDYVPSFKAPYVASASSIPVLIVATLYPGEMRLYAIAASVFFLTIGREMCMDIKDRSGDAMSFMHRFRPTPLAVVAFSLQAIGVLLLATQTRKLGEVVNLLAMILLLALSGVYWFKLVSYRWAIILMKIPFFVGLYFLL